MHDTTLANGNVLFPPSHVTIPRYNGGWLGGWLGGRLGGWVAGWPAETPPPPPAGWRSSITQFGVQWGSFQQQPNHKWPYL